MAITSFPGETLLAKLHFAFCVREKEKVGTRFKDPLSRTFHTVIPDRSAHTGSFSWLHAEWIRYGDQNLACF